MELGARDAAYVCVDAPHIAAASAMPPIVEVTCPELAYLRLHGRNADTWHTGKTVAERYDHVYTRDEMTAWLGAWGEDISPDDHGGMDMGGMDMNGMSQEEMMTQLDGLAGDEFDRAFLDAMIAHHEGAIEMSEQQVADGQNPDAVAQAEKIIEDQRAEITEMREILAGG